MGKRKTSHGEILLNTSALKLGFIGGSIDSAVGATHKISSQMDDRWVLSAGCFSKHDSSNFKTASAWGVAPERVYPSYHELLAAEVNQLDAVAVLTPTPSHTEVVLAALEHGYPVICEKALTKTVVEAKSIKRALDMRKGFLAVTYNYTGYPMVRELQAIAHSGRLGKLQQIHIEMPQEGYLRLDKNNNKLKPQTWRLKDDQIPTLSLDLGVHLHHMIHFLSGERPIELVAVNNNYGFFYDITDNTMCIARYTNDLDCQIWFGKSALGNSNGLQVRVYGEEGSAEWLQMQPETIIQHDNKGRVCTLQRSSVDLMLANDTRYNRFKAGHPAGFIEAFANLYVDIADSLEMYKKGENQSVPWVFGVDVALEGLVMLETMEQSATERIWKTMP
ncbi:MAG: Gfo/Idh/MocA family oxidoreductase [Candidatus Thiodiazotropha sp. (ex Cardiolucina cf. quadrata)]|nr:Gfo/Idh/MocA family oxidoreductase [Candidatus Thiodiazotropha sp. (ex Cardiolucina cf. quadrata)]